MDKFENKFKPEISRQVWGHGESGFVLTLFSSHEEAEVKKARDYLFHILQKDYPQRVKDFLGG